MRNRGELGRWAVRLLAVIGAGGLGCGGSTAKSDVNPGPASGGGGSGGIKPTAMPGGAGATSTGAAAGAGGSVQGGAGGTTSGGTTSGTANVGGQPSDPGPFVPARCENPTPYGGPSSGLVLCEDGMLHRLSREGACQGGPAPSDGCSVDADCPPSASGEGTICVCNTEQQGSCAAATCADQSDCNPGYACVGPTFSCFFSVVRFDCQSDADTCSSHSACGGTGGATGTPQRTCQFGGGPTRHFSCGQCAGAAGRPFLIGTEARTAPTCGRADWLEPLRPPSLAELAPPIRKLLAAHWTRQAELEHASVGAFSRFVLELLSLGAPADLVVQATQALAEETAHARVCYGLASAYAGTSLGPAGLDVRDALADLSLASIVERAVLEGCVGETMAAIEASVAAKEATDPAVRATLLRISEDEARHAELSWAFLRWAVVQRGGEIWPVVSRAFTQAAAAQMTPSGAPDMSTDLRAHGVLSEHARARLATSVFAEVIEPCAAALQSLVGALDPGRSLQRSAFTGAPSGIERPV